MIIQTTKKLQFFFDTNGISIPEFVHPDACWHGNLIIVNRRKAILLTHNITRYSVFIYGITKKDVPKITQRIHKRLREQMMYDEFSIYQIENMLKFSEHFSYFKSSDRKVLGTMNDMINSIKVHILRDDIIDEKKLSSRLNSTPYKIRNYTYPKDDLKSLLDDFKPL